VKSTPEKTEYAQPKSRHPKTQFFKKSEKREEASKAKWKKRNPNH
jgi:hypothetical protein